MITRIDALGKGDGDTFTIGDAQRERGGIGASKTPAPEYSGPTSWPDNDNSVELDGWS